MHKKVKTLCDLRDLLNTLTDEELNQPMKILNEGAPDLFVQDVVKCEIPVFMNRFDRDDFGSLEDLRLYHEDFDENDYFLLVPVGEISFYADRYHDQASSL